MRSGFVRAALLAALAALAGPLAAGEPHPEAQLLAALEDLDHGRVNEAWTALDRLLQRQPNFRLARLFHGELQAARAGNPSRDLTASSDPEIQGLVEEARLRIQQWRDGVPDGALPDTILQLSSAQPHVVVVDLPRSRLYLLENGKDGLRVARNFYASIGKSGWGKTSAGDNRTPVGIYHITGFIDGRTLPELYGAGAFPLNYPNVWDRRLRSTGSGIWLHGVPRNTYTRAPRSSEGCVTLANADLLELKPYFVTGKTPVVLTDALDWRPREAVWDQRAELLAQIEGWRARWSDRDTEAYLAYYAEDFETDGMRKDAFAAHKRRVNAAKKRIEVRLDDVDLFRYPGGEGLVLARFTQHYVSDNYSKTGAKDQFWRRQADGRWRIVKESSR